MLTANKYEGTNSSDWSFSDRTSLSTCDSAAFDCSSGAGGFIISSHPILTFKQFRGFDPRPMLDGSGVKPMPGSIPTHPILVHYI